MPTIKLKSIEFGDIPFRKLKNLRIEFSDRITLISGHNGIGKSTILGLVANSSGLTHHITAPKSYFDKFFQADLSEIIFIDYEREFLSAQEAKALPRPIVTYEINNKEVFKKRCGLTDRSTAERARIVPRNVYPSSKRFISEDGLLEIGEASKAPLPTLYLGMTRLLPLGEAEDGAGYNEVLESMSSEDRLLIADFINEVIVGVGASQTTVTSNRIKGTRKFSSHPEYPYDAKCVSLGQDSLGSIAGAIASFQMLAREWPEYSGGLLIIDELDAGFHPHAIKRLIDRISKDAERLNLQIVATTHSTKLIEAVYSKTDTRAGKNSVAYLADSRSPHTLSSPSLRDILDEMDLVPPQMEPAAARPKLRIYVEDKEAEEIFHILVPASMKRKLGAENGISIQVIAMGVGCDSLANLTSIDPHFKQSIFALDADSEIKQRHQQHGNIVKLAGEPGKSPERTLFSFIKSLVETPERHASTWRSLRANRISTDQITEHLLNWDGDISQRKQAKKWWRDRKDIIKRWKLFDAWVKENPTTLEQFHKEFSAAMRTVAKRVRTLAKSKAIR